MSQPDRILMPQRIVQAMERATDFHSLRARSLPTVAACSTASAPLVLMRLPLNSGELVHLPPARRKMPEEFRVHVFC